MSDDVYRVTASELRKFVESWEDLEGERKVLADEQKDIMNEAKGKGYDPKVIKRLIAMRKRDTDDVANEEAILEVYKEALGM